MLIVLVDPIQKFWFPPSLMELHLRIHQKLVNTLQNLKLDKNFISFSFLQKLQSSSARNIQIQRGLQLAKSVARFEFVLMSL